MAESLREYCDRRLNSMKAIRQDYEAEWRDIARFAQPSRSRFLTSQSASEVNKGAKRRVRNSKLLDPHGIEAFRTLTNGMTSGLTSASRPWFALRLPDEKLNDQPGVRGWLSEVETAMYAFLGRSNFYGAAKAGYGEMGLFGTEAGIMIEHPTAGIVCHALTAGEYWIAQGTAMTPDTLIAFMPMSARQAKARYGDKAPRLATQFIDAGDAEALVEVYQLIEPNPLHTPGNPFRKAWRSVHWCPQDEHNRILDERGFDEQPFWAPRWDVVGGDTYGVSPGMEALPALRELQMQAKRRNEAIDFMVHPEKVVKAGLRLTGEPRRIVSAASFDQNAVLIPYQMPYQAIAAIGEESNKCRAQVDGLSFADLFNAITNMRGIQPRNVEEIAVRNEEKLTQLGPVIERVSNEKLEIVIDRTFGIMMRGGLLPPPPEALAGIRIDVEFVSILAQMQRAVGVGQIERALGMVGNVSAVAPDVIDKVDMDEAVEEYASRLGVPAKIIRSKMDVDAMRAARAQQQNAQQAASVMPAVKDGAQAARLLSETDVGGRSMLEQLTGI